MKQKSIIADYSKEVVTNVVKELRKNKNFLHSLHYYSSYDDWYNNMLTHIEQYIQQRSGYIYLCKYDREPNFVKIGKTRILPEQRIQQLNNESIIGTIYLIKYWKVFDCSQYESVIHETFKQKYNKIKEHFECSEEDAIILISQIVAKHSENYKQLARDSTPLSLFL